MTILRKKKQPSTKQLNATNTHIDIKAELPVAAGEFSSQGSRPYNEDGFMISKDFNEYIAELDPSLCNVKRSLFAVYDGHGGEACMQYVQANLHLEVAKSIVNNKGDVKAALKEAFAKVENGWMDMVIEAHSKNRKGDMSGSTATVCLLEGGQLFCAFLGDSPAWLINSDSSTEALSVDHKPDLKTEKKRIKSNGGDVRRGSKNGPFRVYPGGIAVARAFGDAASKLAIYGGVPGTLIAEPEIRTTIVDCSRTEFLLICSDGITDNLKHHSDLYIPLLKGFQPGLEAARKSQKLAPKLDLDVCAQHLATAAVQNTIKSIGYQDNATAVVVMFGDDILKRADHVKETVEQTIQANKLTKTLTEIV